MNEILNFCLDHWEALASLVLGLASLCLLIFKKKVKINDPLLIEVLELIPYWINSSETVFGSKNGDKKYHAVYESAISYLKSHSDLEEKEIVDRYSDRIRLAIESVLSTPQKKGVK